MCLDRLWDPYETPRGVLSVRSMLSVPITNACMASQIIVSVLAFERIITGRIEIYSLCTATA